jgi:hypothetical protein
MSKQQKRGYIALCIISIFNFVYDNYITIARTHIGMNFSGFLRKVSKFIVSLDGVTFWICVFLPLIVSVIVSVIIFVYYRKQLSKTTAIFASLGFLPYLLFYLFCSIGGGLEIVVIGIVKVIYSIIMMGLMLKNIKKLPVE